MLTQYTSCPHLNISRIVVPSPFYFSIYDNIHQGNDRTVLAHATWCSSSLLNKTKKACQYWWDKQYWVLLCLWANNTRLCSHIYTVCLVVMQYAVPTNTRDNEKSHLVLSLKKEKPVAVALWNLRLIVSHVISNNALKHSKWKATLSSLCQSVSLTHQPSSSSSLAESSERYLWFALED